MKSKITVFVIAVVLIAIRVWVAAHIPAAPLSYLGSYKALAHVFMGWLLAAAWYTRSSYLWTWFVVLNAVEILAVFFGVSDG